MTPDAFRRQLKRDRDVIIGDPQVPASNEATAFEWWCAKAFIAAESSFGTDPDDAVVGSKGDLEVDVVLKNESTSEVTHLSMQTIAYSRRERAAPTSSPSFPSMSG